MSSRFINCFLYLPVPGCGIPLGTPPAAILDIEPSPEEELPLPGPDAAAPAAAAAAAATAAEITVSTTSTAKLMDNTKIRLYYE